MKLCYQMTCTRIYVIRLVCSQTIGSQGRYIIGRIVLERQNGNQWALGKRFYRQGTIPSPTIHQTGRAFRAVNLLGYPLQSLNRAVLFLERGRIRGSIPERRKLPMLQRSLGQEPGCVDSRQCGTRLVRPTVCQGPCISWITSIQAI